MLGAPCLWRPRRTLQKESKTRKNSEHTPGEFACHVSGESATQQRGSWLRAHGPHPQRIPLEPANHLREYRPHGSVNRPRPVNRASFPSESALPEEGGHGAPRPQDPRACCRLRAFSCTLRVRTIFKKPPSPYQILDPPPSLTWRREAAARGRVVRTEKAYRIAAATRRVYEPP